MMPSPDAACARRLTARASIALLAAWIALAFATVCAAQARSTPAAAVPDDPLARRGWHLELTGHGALETWNYNGNHEEMAGEFAGITYGIRDGLALKIASPLYYVWQRGTDGYLFGLTWGVRGRLLRRPRWSAFWEFEVGVSESDTYVPPRGTRFNYLAIGGGGLTHSHPAGRARARRPQVGPRVEQQPGRARPQP